MSASSPPARQADRVAPDPASLQPNHATPRSKKGVTEEGVISAAALPVSAHQAAHVRR